MITRTLIALTACLLPSTALRAQAVLVPEAARFDIDPMSGSCGLFQLEGIAQADRVMGYLGLDTEDRQVKIFWRARKGDAAPTQRLQIVDTPYRPTAVTQHAGVTDKLYVVGWFERLNLAIVERWTVSQAALGEAMSPTGQALTAWSEPTLVKEIVYISPTALADPILRGAACHPFAERLWLLTNEPTRRLLSVSVTEAAIQDPAGNTPVEALTHGDHPYVAGANSIKTLLSTTGGLILLIQNRLHWVSCLSEPYYQQKMLPQLGGVMTFEPEPHVLIVVDDDLDGAALTPVELTDSTFVDTYRGTWDTYFSVP